MIIDDRLPLLDESQGPVTLVRSYRATDDERSRALRPHQAHGILSRLSGAARYGDRHNLIEAFEMVSPGGSALAYRNVSTESLAEAVRTAVRQERLLVVPGWPGHTPPRQKFAASSAPVPEPGPAPEPLPAAKKERTAWFEVEVVDEAGEPVAGVSLMFDAGGDLRQLATAGNGVARLDGAHERSATVSIGDDMGALRSKLDARWSKPRAKEWSAPRPGSTVVEVCATSRPPAISLDAEKRATVVLHPPYRVRLHGQEDTALANQPCTVDVGGEHLELTSDGAGWVEFAVSDACPESARIEWTEKRAGAGTKRSVVVGLWCHQGDENELATVRLGNLGYPVDDLERAVAMFQLDHDLEPEATRGSQIPAVTASKISELWEQMHG